MIKIIKIDRNALLKDKTALVTGATRGIGKAIAILLASQGARVAINGRDCTLLGQLRKEIEVKYNNICYTVCGDITKKNFPEKMVNKVVTRFGKLDILINNAGIIRRESFEKMDLLQWDEVLRVNLTATMLCCHAALPYMKKEGYGKIVNISSNAAKRPYLGASLSYGVSKIGVLNLTRNLALEYSKYGIFVNAVCPGQIETDMCGDWSLEYREKEISKIPLGRIGSPQDVAEIVLFLCSDLSNFIVGESLSINGGSYMD